MRRVRTSILLADGVTGKFMEITMDGYEKTFGGDLKNNVKGIFTDEPEVVSSGGLRWTPDLFEAFRARYGYDLRDQLPALHEEVGDWKGVRHDYFALLNDMVRRPLGQTVVALLRRKGHFEDGTLLGTQLAQRDRSDRQHVDGRVAADPRYRHALQSVQREGCACPVRQYP